MVLEAQGSAAAFLQAVTDFIFVENDPAPSDVILIPGSERTEHVLRAAALYRAGYAPFVLPSGRFSVKEGRFLGDFDTEWACMRATLLAEGVPEHAILREDQATYTWENAQFSRRVADAQGLAVRRALLCCRAGHARRALLYYQAAFPEAEILVCPAQVEGEGRADWSRTAQGRARILGEVSRCGSQVAQVLEDFIAREAAR